MGRQTTTKTNRDHLMKITTQQAQQRLAQVGIQVGLRDGELTSESKDTGWGRGWKFLGKVKDGQVEMSEINSSLRQMGTGLKKI